ncbi:MAG: U32 family peptidase [Mariniphaga sp.]|nr:U32 family peptidase [Mariniphaga sp.]
MRREDVEIMAPVGSYESLMGAIQAGAGSVYFGVEHLNMRARSASNFTLEDIREITRRCKEAGVKSYLTVNVEIFDEEFSTLSSVLIAARDAGITAVIAADMSVIQQCRELGIEVHVSTQVNITNYEAVKFYSQFADVMVLAREMNLGRVCNIAQKIKDNDLRGPSGNIVRLEMFVHGALCMAISGKCYLSLHETHSSANRGSCMQACRRAYIITDKETGRELEVDNEYIMSPKDLKTIHFLNKILDSGVTILKIEGRARSPEYVKTVVGCYHEAVDAYFEGTFDDEKIAVWDDKLASVFNRGFWDGYYLGQRLGEWSSNYGSMATKRKIYTGKVNNYFSNLGVAEIKLETGSLKLGDEIIVTGPSTGLIQIIVEEIRVGLITVDEAQKGVLCSIPVATKLRRSDKLYKLVDASEVKLQ